MKTFTLLLLLTFIPIFRLSSQTVVKMDMPKQADEKLSVTALFNEEIPEGIPVVLGIMGYDVEGGIAPYSYAWFLNGNEVSSDEELSFVPTKGDNLVLKVTDNNKCRATTSFNLKIIRIDAKNQADKNGIKIYPTPAKNYLKVDIPSTPNKNFLLRIIDLNGRIVKEKKITNSTTVNLNLVPGIYFVSIKSGDIQKIEKIIVK